MNSSRHVDNLDQAGKEKWLQQRGWLPIERTKGIKMWKHPDTGTSYHFPTALNLARQDCRLPADFELTPDVSNPPNTD